MNPELVSEPITGPETGPKVKMIEGLVLGFNPFSPLSTSGMSLETV